MNKQRPPREAPNRTAPRKPNDTGRRHHGAIAHRLGVAILTGEYAVGDVLNGEVAFSEALGVSRTAYREAIQVLTAKGLVESRPKTGTRVLPRDRWNLLDPDVLAWAFSGEPDIQFIRGLFELRAIVEPAAAALAAQRRDDGDLNVMEETLGAMAQHTLASEAGRAADRDFHTAILRATRNDALIVLSSSIGAAVTWTTQFKQRTLPLPRNPIPDHRCVFEAIAAGDPEAARLAMRSLVDLALDDTGRSLDSYSVMDPS